VALKTSNSGRSVTVYLRPPAPKKKVNQSRGPGQDLNRFLFRYRHQLAPYGVLFGLACLSVSFHSYGWHVPYLAGLAALVLAFNLAPWHRVGLKRNIERWYTAGCLLAGSLWYARYTAGGTVPDWYAMLALLFGGSLCSIPWWYHHRVRGSIPVRLDDIPDGQERRTRLAKARELVTDWTAFASAAHIQGAKIRAITFTPWSVTLAVELRRGATLGEFTARRMEKLESAYRDCRRGAARVETVPSRKAGMALIRFMLDDPHEYPIQPPELGLTDMEDIVAGLFETGEKVMFQLVNTVIAGMTRSGKSGLIAVLIRALARMRCVAIVGVDLKPGAPELSPWRDVMHALATNPQECAEIFGRLIEGLTWRGEEMTRRGWKNWRPTPKEPFIVVIVDEAQEVKLAGLGRQMDRLASLIGAYGGCLWVATQYPIKENLSPTVKKNSDQKAALHVEDGQAARVVFGDRANQEQWRPQDIASDRKGSFYIRNTEHPTPLLARAFFVTEEMIPLEVEATARYRTQIDRTTWPLAEGEPGYSGELEAGGSAVATMTRPAATAEPEITDAVLVDTTDERILEYVGMIQAQTGHGPSAKDIGKALELSRATVYRWLTKLQAEHAIGQGKGNTYERL
jgi:S-DNA-T family DNA segregation ATPase FtsK/SpoIIIE